MRSLGVLLGALALAACSADEGASDASRLDGSPDFLELVEDARVAVEVGDLVQAGRFYDEALEIDPDNAGLEPAFNILIALYNDSVENGDLPEGFSKSDFFAWAYIAAVQFSIGSDRDIPVPPRDLHPCL